MRFMNVTRIFEWEVRVFRNRFVFSLTSITPYASNILNPLCRKRLSKGLFIFFTCFLHARETSATFVFHLFWFRYSRTFLKSEYIRGSEKAHSCFPLLERTLLEYFTYFFLLLNDITKWLCNHGRTRNRSNFSKIFKDKNLQNRHTIKIICYINFCFVPSHTNISKYALIC